uniref:Very-long-chain 3-oxoacyl-CoA synthase n=1 Tax=viral metagenome TaxID=1070528 RepID=A0A6C0I6H2_9ZZZZ
MSIIAPIVGTVIYTELKHIRMMSKSTLFWTSFFHNLALIYFSATMFYSLTKTIFWDYGIAFDHEFYLQHADVQRLIWWVYASKYYEYMDTALIYASNKQPIFLQKFHHIGAVIVWHLAYMHQCDFIVYVSWLNCGVHSIMYSYYFATLFTKRIPLAVKKTITTLQIAQLFIGVTVLPLVYYFTETKSCYNVLIIFVAYVTALLHLFGHFMRQYFTA